MGFGTKTAKAKPSYTGIQLNTSASTVCLALIAGMARASINLWDYVDFASHEQKVSGGKGFGGSATSFTYSASPIMGLCEGGPDGIAGIARAWKDQGVEATFASFGLTLFTGTIPQAPWGYMASAHADHARGYPGGAYLAKENLDLGSSAALPAFSFEIQGLLYNTQVDGSGDADPAQWAELFLLDTDKGAGFPSAFLDADALLSSGDATTTGDGAYQTYCRAMGFGLSPAMVEQEPASQALERYCLVTNTAPVWTGYSLKLIPYGDVTVTDHGVTYLPPTGVCYDLADDDFKQNGEADPVQVTRSDPADAKNRVNLVIRDRANAYNELPVPYQDDNAVILYGELPADDIVGKDVCEAAMAGRMIALVGQRILYDRNTFSFTLDPRYDRLEPMDVVTLTDAGLGLVLGPVRIQEIDEDENDDLAIVAVQFPGTVGHPSDAAGGTGATPTDINSLAPPGPVNPPILFEPSAALALRLFGSPAACIAAAVSGGDGTTFEPHWGGAVVWISTDDATYIPIGEIDGAARMGVSTAILAAYGGVNPDTVHTLSVDLSMSNGALAGVSSADAAAGATLAYLDGEVLSFKDATLTGTNAYDLGGELYRGLYGTAAGAHASGSDFARLDGTIFKYDLPPAYIGVTLYLKFQSFNIWHQALEDLAGCTTYTFTATGVASGGLYTGGDGVVVTPNPDGSFTLTAATQVSVEATEDIAAHDFVNLYDDAGDMRVRLADATDPAKFANGFARAAILTGATGDIHLSGLNAVTVATTASRVWLSETIPGGFQTTAPAADGSINQPLGVAMPGVGIDFVPQPFTMN